MCSFPARRYLVQLVDALLHAADGRHRPQSVSVELSEAVLPADLEQRHHRSFLHTETEIRSVNGRSLSSVFYILFNMRISVLEAWRWAKRCSTIGNSGGQHPNMQPSVQARLKKDNERFLYLCINIFFIHISQNIQRINYFRELTGYFLN